MVVVVAVVVVNNRFICATLVLVSERVNEFHAGFHRCLFYSLPQDGSTFLVTIELGLCVASEIGFFGFYN